MPEIRFDADALQVFNSKGLAGSRAIQQLGSGNAVKVRRVTQLVSDLSQKPLSELRILDCACGEGVYSLELACRGASIVAYDARDERMNWGKEIAARHGINNIDFQLQDLRRVTKASHGEFDVVLFLGILYHLEPGDALSALRNIRELCRGFVIIDTLVNLRGTDTVELEGENYRGKYRREHFVGASAADKQAELLQSMDNDMSFWFTPSSLLALLSNAGFTSVLECHVPSEPNKSENRKTFVAFTGRRVELNTYPEINGLSEAEISDRYPPSTRTNWKRRALTLANRVLSPLNLEISGAG